MSHRTLPLAVILALIAVPLPAAAGDGVPTFERDVEPILARAGCNAGACHGKARGQNGFQLSILGFDRDFDYHAITRDALGRRVDPASPAASLLLQKATAEIPHGGGPRLTHSDPLFDTLRRWIAAGMPRTPPDAPALTGIRVEPAEPVLANHADQQLTVTAHYSDGSTADVTRLATFQSNEGVIASVDANGLVTTGSLPGEAAIMARFLERFAVSNVLIPLPNGPPDSAYAGLPRANFIDGLVWDKLRRLGLTPSDPAPDPTF